VSGLPGSGGVPDRRAAAAGTLGLFVAGVIVPRKRPRGRPRKYPVAEPFAPAAKDEAAA
jgi:hypothetical protein